VNGDTPPAAIQAAAEAITRCLMSGGHDFSTWMDNDDHLGRIAVEAAAPLIAAAERERIVGMARDSVGDCPNETCCLPLFADMVQEGLSGG
jgi:hypothetical protein